VKSERAADVIRKKRIKSHARCESDRIIGDNTHNHRRKRGDPDRRSDSRFFRDARLGQNIRIDKNDISECDKCGDPRKDLRFDGRILLAEFKVPLDEIAAVGFCLHKNPPLAESPRGFSL